MHKAKTLKQIFYLLIIGILFGVLKVEFFITFIDPELTERTRIISYITLGLSSIFFYFVIILAVLSSFITIDMLKIGSHFEINNFYRSINYFIWFLMINELWKFLLTLFTFKSMANISTENEFNNVLSDNSLWVELISLSDLLFITIGTVAYIIMLRKNEKNVSYLEVIVSTIPLFLSFVIFKIF